MLLGMLTTAATFYGLVFVDFPSLQQLGLADRPQHGGVRRPDAGARAGAAADAGSRRARSVELIWPWLARLDRAASHAQCSRRLRPLTLVLGLARSACDVDPSLERMRSTTPGALYEESVRAMFGLAERRLRVARSRDQRSSRCSKRTKRWSNAVRRELPRLTIDAASALLPSDQRAGRAVARIAIEGSAAAVAQAALRSGGVGRGIPAGGTLTRFSIGSRVSSIRQRA